MTFSKYLLVVSVLVLSAVSVDAAVISGGAASAYLNAPADDPGWSRVGRVGTNGSGVYIGNGWVLTANHVSSKIYFTVDGDKTYSIMADGDNARRLRNVADTGYVDLYMFRVDVAAGDGLYGLDTLDVASSISNNATGVHIGTGVGQTSSTETQWAEAAGIWVETTWFSNEFGYKWSTTRDTRWNYQAISNSNVDLEGMAGFETTFEDRNGFGMVADNDSGSGFFVKNGEKWELAGIAVSVGLKAGQPERTAVYGNTSKFADLSDYRDQIVEVTLIPEPATLALLGLGGTFLAARRRKAACRG